MDAKGHVLKCGLGIAQSVIIVYVARQVAASDGSLHRFLMDLKKDE